MAGRRHRLFIGIPLPRAARDVALSWQQSAGIRGQQVRWESAERLHVTLVFLGAVDAERIASVAGALAAATAGRERGDLALGKGGGFPSLAEPHVIWLGAETSGGWLHRLQGEIVSAMLAFTAEPDDRPYHAHVTVGRVRRGAPRAVRRAIGHAIAAARPPRRVEWPATRVVLYESIPGADGPAYVERFTAE